MREMFTLSLAVCEAIMRITVSGGLTSADMARKLDKTLIATYGGCRLGNMLRSQSLAVSEAPRMLFCLKVGAMHLLLAHRSILSTADSRRLKQCTKNYF